LKLVLFVMLGLVIGAAPAPAAVEQCRFIQAKPDREACYQRQATALAAKRKPEPEQTSNTPTLESLQQMRQEDDAVYKSLRGISRIRVTKLLRTFTRISSACSTRSLLSDTRDSNSSPQSRYWPRRLS
jgi:hypothetical protein